MTDTVLRTGRSWVAVSVRGTGGPTPPLLLLMGLGGHLAMWEPLRSQLDPTRTTIALDVPGTGGSPASGLPTSMAGYGRLTLRVLDRLGIDEVDLLGLSWGGLLAQQIALAAPRRVRRVVLVSTSYGIGGVPGSLAATRELLTTRRYRDEEALLAAARTFGGHAGRTDEDLRAHVAARLARPPSRRGYAHQVLAAATWSSLPLLPGLRRPVLLFSGDEDRAVPALNSRIMARLLPDAHLVLIRGGGHLVLFDRARDVAPIVAAFLDGEVAGPPR